MFQFAQIQKKPVLFQRLFGMRLEEFEAILPKIQKEWDRRIVSHYKRPGRFTKRPLCDMVLVLLLYYRSYVSQEFIGWIFGLDKATVCRIIRRLEPLLLRVMALPKKKTLSQQDLETLIIDVTESAIERPKKNQKRFYSGKKKDIPSKQKSGLRLKERS